MYRVSPLTYLVSGMFAAGIAHKSIECSPVELLRIPLPSTGFGSLNQEILDCATYLGPHIASAGGRVINPTDPATCLYCPIAKTDTLLQSFGCDYSERWRNFGIMWGYVVLNVIAALFLYWLARVPKGWRWRKSS
jgi:ATP-binding cassette subfamily G (WHITE) protein 2 (PDR)